MKKLILFLLTYHTFSCSSDKVNDEEIICADSQLGVNCSDTDYIKNSDSPYVLPWEIGKTFKVGQGNCTGGSHSLGQVQYAYDIDMPIGTNVVAMRSGIVVKVIENFKDLETGTVGAIDEANVINVKHADGTEAQYVHLTYNGALKNEGDNVTQGEIIALSGNTGKSTGPHLHFHVMQALNECEDKDPRENYTWYSCNSIPLTFKNTSEHCHGLLEKDLKSEGYTAESYSL